MRKLGKDSIEAIVERAVHEFKIYESAPHFVSFTSSGRLVNAFFEWSFVVCSMYLSHFDVVYPSGVMRYELFKDFDLCSALCY